MRTIKIDKNWLEQKYLKEKKTQIDIARMLHVCPMTITRYIKKYGLHCGGKRRLNFPLTKQFLILNLKKYKSLRKIKLAFGLNGTTLSRYAKNFGIYVNKNNSVQQQSELSAILNGEIRQWVKWRNFREEILKRDKYRCRKCKKNAKQIHHIKTRKKHPELCFKKSNVITICGSCHMKADKIGR